MWPQQAAIHIQQQQEFRNHVLLELKIYKETAVAGRGVDKHSSAAACILELCLYAQHIRL